MIILRSNKISGCYQSLANPSRLPIRLYLLDKACGAAKFIGLGPVGRLLLTERQQYKVQSMVRGMLCTSNILSVHPYASRRGP